MVTYIKENRENLKNIIKWICFGMLLIIASMTVFALSMEHLQNGTSVTQRIYDYNCTLCVLSIVLHITYVLINFIGKKSEEITKSIKQFFKKEWPCLLLVIFMVWTSVGCIRAGMEAEAEKKISDAYQALQDGKEIDIDAVEDAMKIAEWSSGNRATNAADRSWNGCNNLKDGYFSFLFYATVVVDVILLGNNSEKMKKWILRVMMLAMTIIAFLTFFNLKNTAFMAGDMPYKRAIFHNSNHYGYYLSIGVILCATMFMKEKNWYFKGLALIGYVVSLYMAIMNNTFGAYLGILFSIVALTIYSFVYGISNILSASEENTVKGKLELLKVMIITGVFVFFSVTICAVGEEKPIVAKNFETTLRDVGIWVDVAKSESEESKDNTEIKIEENSTSEAIANTGSGRGEVWVGVFHLIKQKPIFGWGLENLLQAFYDQLDINEGRTHNLILQLMGTTGIPGMLLYMVAVIAIFVRCLKRIKTWNSLEYITMFCFISYMVSSMFGNSAFYTSPYFMIILGILITANWNEKIAIGDGNKDVKKWKEFKR